MSKSFFLLLVCLATQGSVQLSTGESLQGTVTDENTLGRGVEFKKPFETNASAEYAKANKSTTLMFSN